MVIRPGTRTLWIAVCLVGVSAASCTSGPPPPRDERPYEQQILALRKAKDDVFKTGKGECGKSDCSPIPMADRAAFHGLPYFPIDAVYHVPASLDENRTGPARVIQLTSTQGPPRQEQEVGKLSFALGGVTFTLTAFMDQDEGPTRLFVPFRDLTSGNETYGGGRYLDLDRTSTGLYDLDFNRAYHPYCVYNPGYDCPVPPPENRIAIAIHAGERLQP